MRDFERTYEHVRGRTVAVTSWLSGETHTWHASAPGFSLNSGTGSAFSSRHAAISSLVTRLNEVMQRAGKYEPRRLG